jgi:chemotaxis protein CheD
MMPEMIKVSMAESRVAGPPGLLCCIGLGSCVGLALYDPGVHLAGLAHVMLPDSKVLGKRKMDTPFRYADTAVGALLNEMIGQGARRDRVFARLVGGANMFVFAGKANSLIPSIGERNLEAAQKSLAKEKIPLQGQDGGGNYGRSIEFDTQDGAILVRTAQFGIRWL